MKVASVNNLAVGDALAVDNGANAETVTITSVGTAGAAGTGVGVTPALALAHAQQRRGARPEQGGHGHHVLARVGGCARDEHRRARRGLGRDSDSAADRRAAGGRRSSSNWNTTYPQTRWVDVIQNDWAARADWLVKSYDDANHAPVVTTPHLDMVMPPGREVSLSGAAMDPDGDAVTFKWWQYYEADTYAGQIAIDGANTRRTRASSCPPTPSRATRSTRSWRSRTRGRRR